MKVQLLNSGSADCPVLRMFAPREREVENLCELLESLAMEAIDEINFCSLPFMECEGGLSLLARRGVEDLGVVPDGLGGLVWVVSAVSLQKIRAELASISLIGRGYLWLDEASEVSVLFSFDGSW